MSLLDMEPIDPLPLSEPMAATPTRIDVEQFAEIDKLRHRIEGLDKHYETEKKNRQTINENFQRYDRRILELERQVKEMALDTTSGSAISKQLDEIQTTLNALVTSIPTAITNASAADQTTFNAFTGDLATKVQGIATAVTALQQAVTPATTVSGT